MNKSEIKKVVTWILGIALLLVGAFFGYEYITEPKIVYGVMSKNIDDKGKPVDVATSFSPEDTLYFSAKQNRFWVKKARVVWFKGEIAKANRIFVEEEVKLNKAGYFSTKLPENLEEGYYSVTIYVDGKDIRETNTEFSVEK